MNRFKVFISYQSEIKIITSNFVNYYLLWFVETEFHMFNSCIIIVQFIIVQLIISYFMK